jgi:predicted ATPase
MEKDVFVGRERELAQLNAYLDRALAGHGQVCFVVGEAGSGKTALIDRFLEQVLAAHPKALVAVGTSNAQSGIGDPYLPFRETVAMLTGKVPNKHRAMSQDDSRLRTALVRSVQVLVEVAPELIGLFVPGASLAGAVGKALANKAGWMDKLDELTKKEKGTVEQARIFEQYTAFVQRLSAEQPLILFLDDLQWADSASVGLLFHLARQIESSRVLVVGAYRPNDVALGRNGARHPLEPVVNELSRYKGEIRIDLDQISAEESRRFVDALLDSQPHCLEEGFRASLYHRTGGHALFTVELLRALEERGDLQRDSDGCWIATPSLDWDALPARVEGVIEERIDRLETDLRSMLTVASVEGEQFSAEVVARVEARAERDVVRQLSRELQRRHRLVSEQGMLRFDGLRLSLYRFVHNLFQQYLYGNLSEAERIYLHHDIGVTLEALFAEQTEPVAAQLAHHFEQADVAVKAAQYRLQAGDRALRISAHREAEEHFRRGLALVSRLDQGPARMQLELALRRSLGASFVVTQGYAAPGVEQAFSRVRELSVALGDDGGLVPALYGLSSCHFVRAQLQQAIAEGVQLLERARQAGQTGYELACRLVLGAAATHMANLGDAQGYLEQVVAQYDREQHGQLVHLLGHDPLVGALSYLSFVRWHQGYPEQALAAEERARTVADALDHPYSAGYAASFGAMLHQMLGQPQQCQAAGERALAIGKEGGYPMWVAIGMLTSGWAMAQQGQTAAGIAKLREGLAGWEASGARLALPYQRTLLADAYLAAGRRWEGLQAIISSFCCPDDIWWLPEQYRVRAELLLLGPGSEQEAETYLRRAIEAARAHGSKALELRAAKSLAQLLRRQGRVAKIQGVLASLLGAFTEGDGLPDLQQARSLLAEMAVR